LPGALGVLAAAVQVVERFGAVAHDDHLVGQLALGQRDQRQFQVVRDCLRPAGWV
jgi:hypothetical protein